MKLSMTTNGQTVITTFVSKAWKCTAGRTNLATHYGGYDETGTYIPDPRDGKIYLPLIKKGTLIEVNPTEKPSSLLGMDM